MSRHRRCSCLGFATKRQIERYKSDGIEGLRDRRAVPVDEVMRMMDRYRTRHKGWSGPRSLREHRRTTKDSPWWLQGGSQICEFCCNKECNTPESYFTGRQPLASRVPHANQQLEWYTDCGDGGVLKQMLIFRYRYQVSSATKGREHWRAAERRTVPPEPRQSGKHRVQAIHLRQGQSTGNRVWPKGRHEDLYGQSRPLVLLMYTSVIQAIFALEVNAVFAERIQNGLQAFRCIAECRVEGRTAAQLHIARSSVRVQAWRSMTVLVVCEPYFSGTTAGLVFRP